MTAFIILDIDGFKGINDLYGHEAGDELLRLAATRLHVAIGSLGDVLRLGSDEFAAVLSNVESESDALAFAETLKAVFTQPFAITGRTEPLSVSIGMAVAVEPGELDRLHAKAEIALLAAKRHNSKDLVTYDPTLEESIARTTRIRRALYSAIYDDEFELVYQPIVAADTCEITGLEALLRWNSPTVGVVRPDEFIPIAEVTGDICSIGHWVVDNVCRQLDTWTALGMSEELTVSFNVSARQLAEENIVNRIYSTANVWGIDPGRLVVEVTETAALDQSGIAIGRLGELREAGFRISIDDFGSGYSNFGQLLRVPFDVLKIDRSLLLVLSEMRDAAGGDPTDADHIIAAIVSIAEILGVPVVCEGVETEDQLHSLAASGISHIQGYLTGRPASVADTTQLLGLAVISV